MGDAVSMLRLNRTRSRKGVALLGEVEPPARLHGRQQPFVEVDVAGQARLRRASPARRPRTRHRAWSGARCASDRLRRSSGASNATSSVVSSSAASAIPPAPNSTKPAPVEGAAVQRSVERATRDAPAGRDRGERSRLRRQSWVRRRRRSRRSRSTKPFSSGAPTVPRAAIFSVVSPSARTASVKSESAATLRLPFASRLIGARRRSSATVAGRRSRCPTDPRQREPFDAAVPPASADGRWLLLRRASGRERPAAARET